MRKFLVACAGLCVGAFGAAAFTLSPMVATFAPKGRGVANSFILSNESSNRVAFKVQVLTRDIDLDGKETNEPAGDLFAVFPVQGTLMPGSKQTVRVVWRGPSEISCERAFRLVAEELPVEFSPAESTKRGPIRIQLRYMAAVYVQPHKAKPDIRVTSFTQSGTGSWQLIVTNAGTAHQNLVNPKLILIGSEGRGREVPEECLSGLLSENVLAGHARRFIIKLPPEFNESTYQARLTLNE